MNILIMVGISTVCCYECWLVRRERERESGWFKRGVMGGEKGEGEVCAVVAVSKLTPILLYSPRIVARVPKNVIEMCANYSQLYVPFGDQFVRNVGLV